jgi:hypothetical protein
MRVAGRRGAAFFTATVFAALLAGAAALAVAAFFDDTALLAAAAFFTEIAFFEAEALPFAAAFGGGLAEAAFFDAGAIFGAAPLLFLPAAFFFGTTASTFPVLRAAAGGAAFTFAGATRPVPALAMASSSCYFLVAFSINGMTPVFQEALRN